MKVIYTDTIESITLVSGTVDAEYPLTNLQNGHPRKPFRTTTPSCVIRVVEPGIATACAIVLTNASSVSVAAVIAMTYEWGESEAGAIITAGQDETGATIAWVDESDEVETWEQEFDNFDGETGFFFAEFPALLTSGTRTIDITLTALDHSYVSAGLLVIGKSLSFRDFRHSSYKGGYLDNGTEIELHDGSIWYKPGMVQRAPEGHVVMHSGITGPDPAGYATYKDFDEKIIRPLGKTPLAWKLSQNGNLTNIFAGLDEMPSEVAHGLDYKLVSIKLREKL
ncbi:hypothetical protein [Chlorobium sp.]|uniref:hypothetical protein n=1 Tax=Chlorobium sp. TaxID=1095 RepID=UPI003C6B225B